MIHANLVQWKRAIVLLSEHLAVGGYEGAVLIEGEEEVDDDPVGEDDEHEDGADAACDRLVLPRLLVSEWHNLRVLVKVLEKFSYISHYINLLIIFKIKFISIANHAFKRKAVVIKSRISLESGCIEIDSQLSWTEKG